MPTYAMPAVGTIVDGRPAERVGAAFSKQMITELLRQKYGFDGIVLTDFLVTKDCLADCENGTQQIARIGMPWGIESLSVEERFAKALDAGVDEFGGVANSDVIVKLVREGKLSESRLDQSVFRVLRLRFALGLFENPYVVAEHASTVAGAPAFRAEGLDAQRRSHVLLENRKHLLPLNHRLRKVYLYGVSKQVAASYGFEQVDRPEDADIAVVRMSAPFELRPAYFFGLRHHQGSLAFPEDNADYRALRSIPSSVPVITSVYLDRPAILGSVRDRSGALLVNFGASDEALFDVLTGKARPEGRLPFELPSSMATVEAQRPDAPHDSANPLYPIGYGVSY
jgi:beta-glucosidase